MFTGSRMMRPVAYDALSTGISGRTFVMPIVDTPPVASSGESRLDRAHGAGSPWRVAGQHPGRERFAAEALKVAQVAKMCFPARIKRQLFGEPQGVLVSVEQLVDDDHKLFRQRHQLATA